MGRGLYYPGDNGHAWHIENECFSVFEDPWNNSTDYPVFDCDLFADELRNITDELKSLFPSLHSVNRWTRHETANYGRMNYRLQNIIAARSRRKFKHCYYHYILIIYTPGPAGVQTN